MNDLQKYINTATSPFLKTYGFKKRGNTWVLKKNEFLLLIDFQKSRWLDVYYLNAGIQFENLEEERPKTYKAGIRFRLIKENQAKEKDTFTVEVEMPLIQKLLLEQVIEPFASLDTREQVKNVVNHNPQRYLISLKGKEALGLVQ